MGTAYGLGVDRAAKVIYEYRCARHSGGVWVLDESVVRTAAVEGRRRRGRDASRARGRAGRRCSATSRASLIAPLDFTLTENDRLTEETMNVYWYVMGGTAATAVLRSGVQLKRGMPKIHRQGGEQRDNAVTRVSGGHE